MKKNDAVLLVDDNEVDNFIHKNIILHLGVNQIQTTNDGKKAFAWLLERSGLINDSTNLDSVDLILLDINMPDMNGFQLLERLTELGYGESITKKVVILTSSLNRADRETAKIFGVKGFLNKPLTIEAAATLLEEEPEKSE